MITVYNEFYTTEKEYFNAFMNLNSNKFFSEDIFKDFSNYVG